MTRCCSLCVPDAPPTVVEKAQTRTHLGQTWWTLRRIWPMSRPMPAQHQSKSFQMRTKFVKQKSEFDRFWGDFERRQPSSAEFGPIFACVRPILVRFRPQWPDFDPMPEGIGRYWPIPVRN